ncbi:MAG: hypothetical protein Q9159_005527 [Coniocarpon cinnabarinum]
MATLQGPPQGFAGQLAAFEEARRTGRPALDSASTNFFLFGNLANPNLLQNVLREPQPVNLTPATIQRYRIVQHHRRQALVYDSGADHRIPGKVLRVREEEKEHLLQRYMGDDFRLRACTISFGAGDDASEEPGYVFAVKTPPWQNPVQRMIRGWHCISPRLGARHSDTNERST